MIKDVRLGSDCKVCEGNGFYYVETIDTFKGGVDPRMCKCKAGALFKVFEEDVIDCWKVSGIGEDGKITTAFRDSKGKEINFKVNVYRKNQLGLKFP